MGTWGPKVFAHLMLVVTLEKQKHLVHLFGRYNLPRMDIKHLVAGVILQVSHEKRAPRIRLP